MGLGQRWDNGSAHMGGLRVLVPRRLSDLHLWKV